MKVLWPWALFTLALIPLIVALYIWMLRRKRRYAVRFSSIALIRAAMPRHARWRRHLPFALFVTGLAGLLVARSGHTPGLNQVRSSCWRSTCHAACAPQMCRPTAWPSRKRRRAFIDNQPEGIPVDWHVASTGLAEIVPPTEDKEVLSAAIDNFTTSIGTAIGSAVLKSIDAIAEVNSAVAPSAVNLRAGSEEDGGLWEAPPDPAAAVQSYQPDIIVLLTDGANSRGPLPVDAAQQAVDRRLRIYTIGFGTTNPGAMVCTREQLGGDVFRGSGGGFPGGFGGGGGGGGRGFRRYVMLDEPMLREVADMTGGEYFEAENAEQLLDVFLNLPSHVVLQTEAREISVFFSAFALLFIASGVVLSLLWNRFP